MGEKGLGEKVAGEKAEKPALGLDHSFDAPSQHSAISSSESSVALKDGEVKKEAHGTHRQKRRPMSMYSSVGRSVTSSEKAVRVVCVREKREREGEKEGALCLSIGECLLIFFECVSDCVFCVFLCVEACPF